MLKFMYQSLILSPFYQVSMYSPDMRAECDFEVIFHGGLANPVDLELNLEQDSSEES